MLDFGWPESFTRAPMVQRLSGRTAEFADGSTADVDAVILCTGYQHHFPFLDDALRLRTANRLWPLGLWKGVVWEQNPRLIYLGMQDQYYTFNMFDAQAWFAREVLAGRVPVPSTKNMAADSADWRAREETLADPFEAIDYQRDYVKDLLTYSDYPGFDVDRVADLFKEWEHHKVESIMGYRDRSYPSVVTGTMSPRHHTPWLTALDDSLETFLGPRVL
jgi:trimethylamine monooxygenase